MPPEMPRSERFNPDTYSEFIEGIPIARSNGRPGMRESDENAPQMNRQTGVKWSETWQGEQQSLSEVAREALKRRKMSSSPRIDSGVGCGMEIFDEKLDGPNGENNPKRSHRHSACRPKEMDSVSTCPSKCGDRDECQERKKASCGLFQLEWFDNEQDARKRTEEIMRGRGRSSFHKLHSTATSTPHGRKRGSEASASVNSIDDPNPAERNRSLLERLGSFAGRLNHSGQRSNSSSSDTPDIAALQLDTGLTSLTSGQLNRVSSCPTTPDDHQDLSTCPRLGANRLSSIASSAFAHIQRRGMRPRV